MVAPCHVIGAKPITDTFLSVVSTCCFVYSVELCVIVESCGVGLRTLIVIDGREANWNNYTVINDVITKINGMIRVRFTLHDKYHSQ